MAIDDYKVTNAEVQAAHVQAAPNTLTGTAQENKAVFDGYPELLKDKHNGLIDAIDDALSEKADSSDVEAALAEKADIDDVDTALAGKVDKIEGKGLSANDYIDADKALVGTITNKVDKETGKGLSSNDYTTAEKTKLAGIETGAETNVQSDWSQSDSSADDYIKNKPPVPSVDSTLSTSGAAADAKKAGDEITGLKSETSDIDYNIGTTPISMTQGKVINLNVSTVDRTDLVDRAGCACAVVPCIQGDVFIVTAEGVGNYRSYAFIDSNGARKEYAASGVTLDRKRLVAPPYSAYLIINDSSGSVSYIGETVDEQLNVVKQLKANAIKKTAGKNLFDAYSENIVDGYYVGADGGLIAKASYCVSDYISVTAGSSYAISNCYGGSAMSVAFYDKDFNVLSVTSSSPTSVTAPTNAVYMRVPVLQVNRYVSAQIELGTASSYLPYTDKRYSMVDLLAPAYDSTATYSTDDVVTYEGFVYKAIADIDTAETFNSTHWTRIPLSQAISGSSGSDAKAIVISDNSISASGNALSANEAVELGIVNVAKHIIYELVATFSSFDTIKIGHGTDSTKYASWVEIDDTNITIYANMGETPYRSSVSAHGLTIADFINVQIVTDDTYKCYVLLQTNGGHYKTSLGTFYGNCDGQSYFVATSALTSYKFRKIFVEATKPIYLFGDSYMSFASNRWVYYLKDVDQFNNVLINACGGENSERGTHALASLKGNPKYALWTYGMNDSSDADNTTPASNWLAGVTAFLAWCTQQNVTPVFGTIPTVPSKNHEAKNAYIRNSGYRYIDFAKAVGAQADGTWYSGMVSDDNIHPTIEGAIAQFNRAIVDFPEIMTRL